MKTIQKTLWLGLACAAMSLGVQAQDSRIGYINTQLITTQSAPAKAAQAKLEQEFSKRQKELVDLVHWFRKAS